jgi:hypothetical protein
VAFTTPPADRPPGGHRTTERFLDMTSQQRAHGRAPLGAIVMGVATLTAVVMLADVPRGPIATVPGAVPAAARSVHPVVVSASGPPKGTVRVSLGTGVLAITTPYTAASPLQLVAAGAASIDSVAFGSATDIAQAVKVLDTRSAELGFVAQVQATDPALGGGAATAAGARAGMVGVQAVQVQGNGLRSGDVRAADAPPGGPGLTSPRTIASYAGGLGIGTAWLAGTLELQPATSDGDAVTVTFTAF